MKLWSGDLNLSTDGQGNETAEKLRRVEVETNIIHLVNYYQLNDKRILDPENERIFFRAVHELLLSTCAKDPINCNLHDGCPVYLANATFDTPISLEYVNAASFLVSLSTRTEPNHHLF